MLLAGVSFPDSAEEIEHHLGAFLLHDAAFEFDLVIVSVGYLENVIAGYYGAALGFVSTEIDLADPGLDYGAGAHRAGL